MRERKELIKNKKFYRMCREQFKLDKETKLSFKKWVVFNWKDLLESFELLK